MNLEKTDDGFSKSNSPVPPLPPRRSVLVRNTVLDLDYTSQSRHSNSSGEIEFSPGTSPRSGPPPIPSHSSIRMPAIPSGRIPLDSEPANTNYNNYNPCGPSITNQTNVVNGNKQSVPVSRTSTISESGSHDSVFLGNEPPPPIPKRPTRQSNSSQSSDASSSTTHTNQEYESSSL